MIRGDNERVYLEACGEGASGSARWRATASDSESERGSSDCEGIVVVVGVGGVSMDRVQVNRGSA